jgi:hypothetical protein
MRGGVRGYAAQAAPQIDAEIAEKGHFGTGTSYPQSSLYRCSSEVRVSASICCPSQSTV